MDGLKINNHVNSISSLLARAPLFYLNNTTAGQKDPAADQPEVLFLGSPTTSSSTSNSQPPPPGTEHGELKTPIDEAPKLPSSLWSKVGQNRQRPPDTRHRRRASKEKSKKWAVKNMLHPPQESDPSLLYLPKTRRFVDFAPFCNYKYFKNSSDDDSDDEKNQNEDSDSDGSMGRLAKKFAETNLTPIERMQKMLQMIERK